MKRLKFPTGKITDKNGAVFISKLKSCKDDYIQVTMDSPGGDCVAGFKIIQAIKEVTEAGRVVHIHVVDEACSMASIILQVATRRTIEPFGSIMLHESRVNAKVTFEGWTPVSQIYSTIAFYMKQDKKMCELLDVRSGKKRGYWHRKTRGIGDLNLTADEALKFGLVDEICSLGTPPKPPKIEETAIEN